MRKVLKRAAAGVVLLSVTGCCGISAINFSSPQPRSGVRTQAFTTRDARMLGEPVPEEATFTLRDGLDVEINAANRQWIDVAAGPELPFLPLPILPWPPGVIRLFRGTPAPAPLQIWLRVGPDAAADFDPTRMRIVLPDGAAVAPTALVGKVCTESRDCDVSSDLPSLPLAPIVIERSGVFIVSFPTVASPDRPFTARVEGFTRDGTPISGFDVEFAQRTAWALMANF